MNIKEIKKQFPYRVRIKDKDLKRYVGYSDLVETYCCISQPAYFVVFPKVDYSGYFNIYEVEELKK